MHKELEQVLWLVAGFIATALRTLLKSHVATALTREFCTALFVRHSLGTYTIVTSLSAWHEALSPPAKDRGICRKRLLHKINEWTIEISKTGLDWAQ